MEKKRHFENTTARRRTTDEDVTCIWALYRYEVSFHINHLLTRLQYKRSNTSERKLIILNSSNWDISKATRCTLTMEKIYEQDGRPLPHDCHHPLSSHLSPAYLCNPEPDSLHEVSWDLLWPLSILSIESSLASGDIGIG